jgi:flagellar protein FlgJ
MAGIPLPGIPPAPAPAPVMRPPASSDPTKLLKAAQDFEAMAIGELLKPMFDTVDTAATPFSGGPGEEAWKPMLIQEYAKKIEAHGGLGLATSIYQAMLRRQQEKTK